MKAIILAGGFGSRLAEETVSKPKPMVEIGGKPILWHIMKIFAANGINEFIVALGYKGEIVKRYFLEYDVINNDITVDFRTGCTTIHDEHEPPWRVDLMDTGFATQTGGRLKRLRRLLQDDDTFMFTYGDGVADLNIGKLLRYHKAHGKLATVTAVRAPARFGQIAFERERVTAFQEKSKSAEGWINGGYFVLHAKAIDYIDGDDTVWEREPIERLAREGQLMGYRHYGFWSCMDTLREKNLLDELWDRGRSPWKIWPDKSPAHRDNGRHEPRRRANVGEIAAVGS